MQIYLSFNNLSNTEILLLFVANYAFIVGLLILHILLLILPHYIHISKNCKITVTSCFTSLFIDRQRYFLNYRLLFRIIPQIKFINAYHRFMVEISRYIMYVYTNSSFNFIFECFILFLFIVIKAESLPLASTLIYYWLNYYE